MSLLTLLHNKYKVDYSSCIPVGKQEGEEHSVLDSKSHENLIWEASLISVDCSSPQEGCRGTEEAECSQGAQLLRVSLYLTTKESGH